MRGEIELRRDDFRDTPRMLYRTDGHRHRVRVSVRRRGAEAREPSRPPRRAAVSRPDDLGRRVRRPRPDDEAHVPAAEARGIDHRYLRLLHVPQRAAAQRLPGAGRYACAARRDAVRADGSRERRRRRGCARAFVEVTGEYEYVQGFGSHYMARPSVRLAEHDAQMTIAMDVTNLGGTPMDLMYMAHLNYAYVPGGRFVQALPRGGLRLRDSVPAHVRPTAPWRDYTATLAHEPERLHTLDAPALYDPEIVFFMNGAETDADGRAFPARTSGWRRIPHRVPPRAIPACDALDPAQRGPAGRRVRAAVDLRRGYEAERRKGHGRRSRPVRRAASKSSPAT